MSGSQPGQEGECVNKSEPVKHLAQTQVWVLGTRVAYHQGWLEKHPKQTCIKSERGLTSGSQGKQSNQG